MVKQISLRDTTNEREKQGYEHHLPKLLTLKDLPHLGTHRGELWIERDNLVEDGGIRHERRHLL